ncbi:MAG: glycoside hydrolase family 127 protein [Pirellulales bacterium]|nr:glycoside hydrolase family 127 protein [Pirellulales bacterium]
MKSIFPLIIGLIGWTLSLPAANSLGAEDETGSPVQRVQRCSESCPAGNVQLRGEWGTRYQAAVCNLLCRTDRYTFDSFKANALGREGALWWDWPGDQFGRWFSVLQMADGYGWNQAGWHRAAVADVILPLQKNDGHFGPPEVLESDDARIPSGNAFGLAGLMDAYRDTGETRYLDAARRSARYFQTIAPQWETKGKDRVLHEFYGHCLDGLVALHESGNEPWALDLAKRLGVHAGRATHTHHALSMCRGLVDLARATGRREYRDRAEDYLDWCRENQLVTGGLPEMMPQSQQDEGCALADWIVVNLKMFETTGEDRYLDDAEHMLVNHFFMNQFHTGGFGHLGFDQKIVGGKAWQGWEGRFGSENPGCCSLWGMWALGQAGRYIVTQKADTIHVNLYPEAQIVLPDHHAQLRIDGDFPRMRRATITLRCDRPETFALALRVPRWADRVRVECDGQTLEKTPADGRVVLRRQWAGTTAVSVAFDSGPRVVAWPAAKPLGVAVFDGPLCLGLSSAAADVDLPWFVRVDKDSRPELDAKGRPVAVDPSSGRVEPLRPIGDDWLAPDAKEPRRFRVLFERKALRAFLQHDDIFFDG